MSGPSWGWEEACKCQDVFKIRDGFVLEKVKPYHCFHFQCRASTGSVLSFLILVVSVRTQPMTSTKGWNQVPVAHTGLQCCPNCHSSVGVIRAYKPSTSFTSSSLFSWPSHICSVMRWNILASIEPIDQGHRH